MKQPRKPINPVELLYVSVIISIIVIAAIWIINHGFDEEPVVTFLGSVAALIAHFKNN